MCCVRSNGPSISWLFTNRTQHLTDPKTPLVFPLNAVDFLCRCLLFCRFCKSCSFICFALHYFSRVFLQNESVMWTRRVCLYIHVARDLARVICQTRQEGRARMIQPHLSQIIHVIPVTNGSTGRQRRRALDASVHPRFNVAVVTSRARVLSVDRLTR